MSEEQKNQKRNRNIVKAVIIVSFVTIILSVGVPFYISNEAIQVSELPLEQLNNGYDLVCKSRDHQSLCIYNSTAKTSMDLDGKLNVPIMVGNKYQNKSEIVDIIKIDLVNKNDCFTQYSVGYKNNTVKSCTNGAYFPKNTWSITPIHDQTGMKILYELYNGSLNK